MSWQVEGLAIISIIVTGLVCFNVIRDIITKRCPSKFFSSPCKRCYLGKTDESTCYWVIFCISLLACLAVGTVFYASDPTNYQETAKGISGTTVNIDGLALTQFSHHTSSGQKVWDPLDIAEPPAENTEFFITTKRVKTGPQNLGDCVKSNKTCSYDSECAPNALLDDYDGVSTGTCVNGTCSVLAWCPPEYDEHHKKAHREVLSGPLNFYVLIQSNMYIQFNDGYSKRYSNIVTNLKQNGKHCDFSEVDDDSKKCPYFKLADIVNNVTNNDNAKYNELMDKGGVIAIRLLWKCNLEDAKSCPPRYSFTRLDSRTHDYAEKGYSFTDSEYSYGNGSRTHVRSTGILFVILIEASGYRFAWYKLLLMMVTFFVFTASTKPITDLLFFGCICIDAINANAKAKA